MASASIKKISWNGIRRYSLWEISTHLRLPWSSHLGNYRRIRSIDLAVSLIHDIARDYTKIRSVWEFDRTMSHVHSDDGWPALLDLFQRPWFTRAWVLQEVVLSKWCSLICGTKTISWDVLTIACKCLRECLEAPSFQEDIRIADYMTVVSASLRNFGDQEHRSPVAQALTAARSLKATNPRDKIYSLLGIISSKDDNANVRHVVSIIPDYTKSINDVFISVAKLAIS
jgi:hypothetical protein